MKDKNEYFERTTLEHVVIGTSSLIRRLFNWMAFDVAVIVMIIVVVMVAMIAMVIIVVSLPSDMEQRQVALDTYYECRNVQELSEEACLLLALDID